MAKVMRVARGSDWHHVPDNDDNRDILARMLGAGLAKSDGAGIRLLSETGPVFWDGVKSSEQYSAPAPRHAVRALRDGGIVLLSGEMLMFGRHSDGSYNDYADMSWLNNPSLSGGLAVSAANVEDGDIVMTAWPGRRRLVPARTRQSTRQMTLEMTCPMPRGERCFVLDESGTALLTASMASSGEDIIKAMQPAGLVSWLASVGSKAMPKLSGRFSVKEAGTGFVIEDATTGKGYAGQFQTSSHKDEAGYLEWVLARHGLGGILQRYELARA